MYKFKMNKRKVCKYVLSGLSVELLAMLLAGFLFLSCTGQSEMPERAKLHDRVENILELQNPKQRYVEFLGLHLRYPRASEPMAYIARLNLEAGDNECAEVWLKRARGCLEENSKILHPKPEGDPVRGREYDNHFGLIWYLSALNAYELEEFTRCVSYLHRMDECAGIEESGYYNASQLLKTRVFLSQGSDKNERERGLKLVMELMSVRPRSLNSKDILRAVDICIGEGREKTAKDLLLQYGGHIAYGPTHSGRAARLCRECGLEMEAYLFRSELEVFDATPNALEEVPQAIPQASSEVIPPASPHARGENSDIRGDVLDRIVGAVELFKRGEWKKSAGVFQELKADKLLPEHRFVQFLNGVTRLYCRPGGSSIQGQYVHVSKWYGHTQPYFAYLYRALSGTEDPSDMLIERALQGCIAAGPYTECARDARKLLAGKAGIPSKFRAEPLLEGEMQLIAGLVLKGGPPELLEPLTETLEWPENHYTLKAGVILRQLRSLPAVREYLTRKQRCAGNRGQERIRAILQL